MNSIAIGNKLIGKPYDCFVIAEVGLSHEGSLGSALAFIDAAAAAGADAVKFQTHLAEAEGTPKEEFRVKVFPQDKTRSDYWRRTSFTPEQWKELKGYTEEKNLVFLSTPFSLEAAQMLNELGIVAWKIGSGETNNIPLLEKMTEFKKPFLLSTGMSYLGEVESSVKAIGKGGCELILMQCTNRYPCPPEKLGLNLIKEYEEKFGVPVGFSDHSGNIYSGLAAYTLGASALEVHVTFHKKCFGPDVPASLTFEELKQLVEGVRFLKAAFKSPINKDEEAKKLENIRELFTKGIVAKNNLSLGTTITLDNIDFKKPALGIPASKYKDVIGKKLNKNLKKDDFILLNYLEE